MVACHHVALLAIAILSLAAEPPHRDGQGDPLPADAIAQEALNADIRLLDDVLGAAIQRLAGADAFALQEEVRAAAGALRAKPTRG